MQLCEAIWRRRSLLAVAERTQAAILLLLAGSSLALLINPYGLKLMTFLVHTATAPRLEIAEWRGARSTDLWGQLWLGGVGLTALSLVLSRRRRSLPLLLPLAQAIEIQPRTADFPVRAVAVLRAADLHGNMATEFNWGEYVIWHLGPRVQVSVDGRRETVYSDEVYRENLAFMRGEGQWDHLVDRPETDLALVDRVRPVYNLMRAKTGWTLAYEDALAAVFVRADSTLRARIANISAPDLPADGTGLAFP